MPPRRGPAEILILLAGGLFILPFFFGSATAGQLADQHDRAWLIQVIKLSEIALMLAAATAVLAGSTTALLALLCVMGVEAAFLGPLKYAILPDLLAPHELLLGNALVEAGTFIAILLGTIAGVLIASRHGAALVAGLIVLVALAAWGASLAIPQTAPAAARSRLRWNLLAATARVIREAAREKIPFRSILGISWFWLAGAIYLSQFPAYVRFLLGGREAVVTLFLAVFTIGIALGSLFAPGFSAAASARGRCRGARWASACSRSTSGRRARLLRCEATPSSALPRSSRGRRIGGSLPIFSAFRCRAAFLSCRSTRCCRRRARAASAPAPSRPTTSSIPRRW